jgi:hypothetical protein
VDGNGKVNFMDYNRLMRYVKYHDIEVVLPACDVDGNGKVNLMDYSRLMRYVKYHDIEIF